MITETPKWDDQYHLSPRTPQLVRVSVKPSVIGSDPSSILPPGSDHSPAPGGYPRLMSSNRPRSSLITAPTHGLRFDYVSELSRAMSTIWPHLASTLWDKGRELRTGRLERRRWIRATADIEPGRRRRTELHGLSGPARRPQLPGPDLDPRPAQGGRGSMDHANRRRAPQRVACPVQNRAMTPLPASVPAEPALPV